MNLLSRTTTALLLLAALTNAQERPAPPDFTKWTPLDRVVLAVNTDALTLNAINKKVAQRMSQVEISTQEEFQKLWDQTLQEEVRARLTEQAGEDMGYDRARVEAVSRAYYQEEVERVGGIGPMGDVLTTEGQTAREKQEQITQDLYGRSWRNSQIGLDAGPGGRPYRDRYVRPSRLCQIYRRMAKTGANIGYLQRQGARPALYELQALLVESRQLGGAERAEERAREVRQALETGALDWDKVIDELGALPNRGVLGPLPMADIQRALDPGDGSLLGFVLAQKENSYSGFMPFAPPNPTTGERRVEGFAIYRFLAYQPASIPGFTEPGVQQDLTFFIQREHAEELVARGLIELEADAYVWFTGIERRKQRIAEAEQEQEREALEARERNAEEERARKGLPAEEKPPAPGAVEKGAEPPEPPGGGS